VECSAEGRSRDARLTEGIDAILEADSLTEPLRRDILCRSTARFLEIDDGMRM
jgi:hypothetical protein